MKTKQNKYEEEFGYGEPTCTNYPIPGKPAKLNPMPPHLYDAVLERIARALEQLAK